MKNPPQLNHRYTETGNGILVPPAIGGLVMN